MTLVELMVGAALGLSVILAASGLLATLQRAYAAVEAQAELDERGQLAYAVIRALVTQAGYPEAARAAYARSGKDRGLLLATGPRNGPVIEGHDDRTLAPGTAAAIAATSVVNHSDVLIVHGGREPDEPAPPNCLGIVRQPDDAQGPRMLDSYLYIDRDARHEPALYCLAWGRHGRPQKEALVHGVETLQVLYGWQDDGGSLRYRPAAEVAHEEAWTRVHAVRIGLVLRSAIAARGTGRDSPQLHPLGLIMSDAASDAGSVFSPTPDGRRRQVLTFDVALRNSPETR